MFVMCASHIIVLERVWLLKEGYAERGGWLCEKEFEMLIQLRTASCHVGQTCTRLITEVKQRWAQLVLGWMISQMTSIPGAARR
jgi:hypothetical protein